MCIYHIAFTVSLRPFTVVGVVVVAICTFLTQNSCFSLWDFLFYHSRCQLPRWSPVVFTFWYSHSRVVPLTSNGTDLSSQQDITQMKCDCWGQVIKNKIAYMLVSLGSLTLPEAGCCVMQTLMQAYGKVHMERNWDLLPRGQLSSVVSGSSWKRIL